MPRKKSKSKSRCRHGSKVGGGCKRKPGPKKGSRRSRKSVARFIGPCKHGLVKDGSRCRKRPLRRSRRRSKSTAFNTCMYGLVKDGSRCRKRPAPKRRRSRKRSSRKRRRDNRGKEYVLVKRPNSHIRKRVFLKRSKKSRRCKYGLLKDGSRCRKRPGRSKR